LAREARLRGQAFGNQSPLQRASAHPMIWMLGN